MKWDTLAVVNIKGGTSKTTAAVTLAAIMAEDGPAVVIDGDPQGSASKWCDFARAAGLEFPVDVVTPANLMGEYRWYIVDTPPHDTGAVTAALLEADLAVVPVAPTGMDIAQLPDTRAAVDAARKVNKRLRVAYLLTKVRAGTAAARDSRAALGEDLGLPLLRCEIPLRESVARTFGELPDTTGPYRAVYEELREMMRT